MSEYKMTKVAVPIMMTKPATFHKWVWFWQVGWHKVRGWQVKDRTLLKAKVWRETRLEDYIYSKPSPLQKLLDEKLYSDGTMGGIDRGSNVLWRNREGKS